MYPIKVLHLIPNLSTGGAESLLVDTAPLFDKNIVNISICTFFESGKFAEKVTSKGIPLFAIDAHHNPISRIKSIFFLLRFIKKNKITIIHVHLMLKYVLILKPFLRKVRFVCTLHSNVSYNSFILNRYDHVICCGKNIFQNITKQISSGKCSIVNNAVALNKFAEAKDSLSVRKKFGIPENAFVIFTAGRLIPLKNQAFAINAFHYIQKSLPERRNLYLIIAGDGALKENLINQVISLDLSQNILLPGNISDIGSFYAACDLYINTSKYEGLSITILEAMSKKIPVLASNVDGNKEIYNGNNIVLYNPEDINDFCDKFEGLCNNDSLRTEIGNNGFKYMQKEHNIDTFIKKTSSVYMNLCNTKNQ